MQNTKRPERLLSRFEAQVSIRRKREKRGKGKEEIRDIDPNCVKPSRPEDRGYAKCDRTASEKPPFELRLYIDCPSCMYQKVTESGIVSQGCEKAICIQIAAI